MKMQVGPNLSLPGSSMYQEWSSLRPTLICDETRISVLHKLPQMNATLVVNSCVRPLAGMLATSSAGASHGQHNQDQTTMSSPINCLQTDRDVLWMMEVICYGLSLPLSTNDQHEAVRDCVNIYCEWLTSLTPSKAQSKSIPFPVRDDPNMYCRKILQHLYNIFMPRHFSGQESNILDVISRQALLCHRILRTIECIVHEENVLDRQTWDTLLLCLLAINDTLLAPPAESNDIGTQLCERIVSVLFDIWLVSCFKCFPSPSYWKTFQLLCSSWRHRPALIEQWSKFNIILTQRLVQKISPTVAPSISPSVNAISISTPNHIKEILDNMSAETLKQTWFRFLHTIGNPVDLCHPEIISKTDKFYHAACASENVVDPRQHPCLNNLPFIFYRSIKGISTLVDIFLGIPVMNEEHDATNHANNMASERNLVQSLAVMGKDIEPATPPEKRKITFPIGINKSVGKQAQTHHHKQQPTLAAQRNESANIQVMPTFIPPAINFPPNTDYVLSSSRPKSTSILDILGDWLFQAALFGAEIKDGMQPVDISRSGSTTSFTQQIVDASGNLRKTSIDRIVIETLPLLTTESFEAGQAEAIGALCRLFCFKREDEEISKVLSKKSHPSFQKVKQYLTKFHLALQYGLTIKEPSRRQILASILINSTKIFQVDLPGASLLIPHYLKALEIYMMSREKLNTKSEVEIRRACIRILLSLLSYPNHFNELPIKDTLTETPSTTFQSLRPRLINLLIQALQGEPDSINVQILLGSFLLLVQDGAMHEAFSESDSSNEIIKSNSFSGDHMFNDHSPNSPSNVQSCLPHCDPSCDSSLASTEIQMFDDGKGIPDTFRGMFARSLYHIGLVLGKCKERNQPYDSQVSLAALEVLSTLGRIQVTNSMKTSSGFPVTGCFIDCKETTHQICNFIESQCEKPAPFHSKDMHSTIVAAYQSLAVWFNEHSHLLRDRECISMLLDVIELGISGTKSKKSGHVYKSDKQLKPASMRVREAAESLLTLLMNHFGFLPSSPTSLTSNSLFGACLIDETAIIKSKHLGNNLTFEQSCEKFKYFVTDNLIVIAILDEPNEKETVCIIRSPFGKYCWSFKFEQLPWRHNVKIPPDPVLRPTPKPDMPSHQQPSQPRCFPESLDKIRTTKFDTIIPTLQCLIASSVELKAENETMLNIIDKVQSNVKFDKEKMQRSLMLSKRHECKEPSPSSEFEAARLILSHFGFLTFETLQDDEPTGQMVPSMVLLDQKHVDFTSHLRMLDSLSNRTSDTVFIYYVRKGMTSAKEILDNVKTRSTIGKAFKEFLMSLGAVVDVHQHAGWTGHTSTSWRINEDEKVMNGKDDKSLMLDGTDRVIYWADVCQEIAFVLPSKPFQDDESDKLIADNSGDKLRSASDSQSDNRSLSSMSDDGTLTAQSRTHSDAESTRSSLKRKFRNNMLLHNIGCDVKVIVIWLESMDDQHSIPINTLLLTTGTGVESNLLFWKDYTLIFIHPLKNGLFRIAIQGSAGRFPLALPLIDGMLINKDVLGNFVRLSALNICRRRRLDTESFQPPHVKRRLKIQELINKCGVTFAQDKFYNSLLSSK